MNDESEPERRTIHVFDIDLETGEVPVRELHVVREPAAKPGRTSILSLDLSKVIEKLDRLPAPPSTAKEQIHPSLPSRVAREAANPDPEQSRERPAD
jgi:hypothetical protein